MKVRNGHEKSGKHTSRLILTFAICLSANAWVEVVDCGSIEIEGLRPIKNGYHLMDVDEENSFVSDVVRGCPERQNRRPLLM